MRIIRLPNESKEEFLYHLTNNFGYDVEISYNYEKNGQRLFSKWRSYLWLSQYEPCDYVPELRMTRKEFIDKVTHRSILDIEILIDIDDPKPFDSIEEKFFWVKQELDKRKLSYTVYFSGSKSYHISLLFPELRNYPKHVLFEMKKRFLEFLGADVQKAAVRTMIAFEGEPHWKTGKRKEVVLC